MEKAINKVILGDTTLMDISEDTVTEDNLLEGVTAHAADGTQITGKVVVAEIVDSLEDQSTDKALSARQGYVLDQKIYKPEYTSFDKTKEPTEYSDIDLMTSGQVLPTILGKVTLMLKNIRYFFKLIGSTDISSIGDGTLTGALSTLNSNLSALGTLIIKQVNAVNIQVNETVDVNIDIDQSGLYLLLFQIAHCGANEATSVNASWSVDGFEQYNSGIIRSRMEIPIARTWDTVCGSCCCLQYLYPGTRTFTFINQTGVATNAMYNSSFAVIAVKLK